MSVDCIPISAPANIGTSRGAMVGFKIMQFKLNLTIRFCCDKKCIVAVELIAFWDIICEITNLLKACVHYFLSNFCFLTKWQSFKNYEKCFLFHLKSSFYSRDIQFFLIFPLLFHTFQMQKDKWKWNNFWCHELACINLQI